MYGGDNNNQNSSGPGEGVAAEVKQSLFTLWTADLMLEREGKTHAHTPYARLVGEKRAGHGRAGRGLEARIRYYYYCGIRALATTHLGGVE